MDLCLCVLLNHVVDIYRKSRPDGRQIQNKTLKKHSLTQKVNGEFQKSTKNTPSGGPEPTTLRLSV